MSLALCALLVSLCGSAYSTAVWPQTSYNAQRTSFSMSNFTSRTVECQPTLTSTIQLSEVSVYIDWDFDPVIGNNSVLYYNKDQRSLAALDVSSNTVLWTLEANSSFSAPVLSQDGQLLYILRDVINFTVYSVKTKEIVWYYDRIPLDKLSDFHKNIVIAPNGIVYLNIVELVASNFAALYAFNISMAPNTELWNRTGFQFSTPVVSEDGKLYARNEEALYSLNPATGSTIWTLPSEHSNATGGIRVRSDGNLLCKTDRYLLLVSPGGDILDNATDFEDYAVTPDGRVIGVLLNPPYPTVTVLNSEFDRFEWSIDIRPIVFTSLTISVIDNEIYVHTINSNTGSTSIVKFDMEGNIIWTTSVEYTPATIGFGFSNVIPVGDGSIIVRTGTFLQHFTSCNAGNGTCKTLGGICECKANYFGDSCSAHCECENGKCSATGQCQCDEGWGGDNCSTKESNNALVIGLSVGAGVLVVGAVAAFLLIRHRRKSHYEEISH